MAYHTGRRIVEMVRENLRPLQILTREAFLNAIVVNTAIGGSTNCPPHLLAIARHAGVELTLQDWEDYGHAVPLLVNCQPAGEHMGEDYHRAGGVPGVMRELLDAGLLRPDSLTVTGNTVAQNLAQARVENRDVIRSCAQPMRKDAGFLVLRGNLFEGALIKTSVISPAFRQRYLSKPGAENRFDCRAIVFEGPEDYHARLNDPSLGIDENSLLVIRGCGPVGFPGSAEVVNMQPPDAIIRAGGDDLPTMGDGRQSGTSASPSILNASPEACVGGGLARLKTGDIVRVDLTARTANAMVCPEEWEERGKTSAVGHPPNETPWQQLHREKVGQLAFGACFDFACEYRDVCAGVPRHSH
jgi:dihydroxy-acid dehydratase